jgi:hypothetical protein
MSDAHVLTTGQRRQSSVCDTEIIVIRPASTEIDLWCGGAPMTPLGETLPPRGAVHPSFAGGTMLGKRYTHPDDDSLELLVTKAGAGSLSAGPTLLVLKASRQLPTSD